MSILVNYYDKDNKNFIRGAYIHSPFYIGQIINIDDEQFIVVSYKKIDNGFYHVYVDKCKKEGSCEYKFIVSFCKLNKCNREFIKDICVDVIPAIGTMVIIDDKRYRVIDFITNYNTNTKICIVEEY